MAGKSFSVKDEILTKFKEKCNEMFVSESRIVNKLIELWIDTDGGILDKNFKMTEHAEEKEDVEEEKAAEEEEVPEVRPFEEITKPTVEMRQELCPKCGKEWDYQYCRSCGFCWDE